MKKSQPPLPKDDPLSITCPFCGEPPGHPCRTRSFEHKPHKVKTHLRRILKAKGEGL